MKWIFIKEFKNMIKNDSFNLYISEDETSYICSKGYPCKPCGYFKASDALKAVGL